MSKPKVIVIFPKYSKSDASHYGYWYPVFSNAGKKIDLQILFEKPAKDIQIKNTLVLDTPNLPKPLNLVFRFLAISKQLLSGYKKIYIHYSYPTFFLTKLATMIFGGKVYYWNCEYYNSKTDSDSTLPIVLKLTDFLITGSQTIGDRYGKIFGFNKPVKIVSNYVSLPNPGENKPGIVNITKPINLAKNKYHILFVHRLTPRKGSQELPNIIKETIKLIPNAHFHIIGSGSGGQQIRRSTLDAQLSDHVTFHGALSRPKTLAFYQACDIFIMPSRSEGFPRVILEAMLNKIPIVSTNVGNVTELVGEKQRGFITKTNDPKQFAKTIFKLKNSKSKANLIEQNYQKALQYNLDRSVQEFTNCFTTSS